MNTGLRVAQAFVPAGQLAPESCVCRQATMPTENLRSPENARMAAVTIAAIGAQPLGDGKHHVPVRHGLEQRRVEQLGPDGDAIRVTAQAEVAILTRECEQVLDARIGR